MAEQSAPKAVEIAESAWEDPYDKLMSGTYRVTVIGDPLDHLVVYIRGAGGDPTAEYMANRTVCGKEIVFGVRRLSDVCVLCLADVGDAFGRARTILAGRAGGPPEDRG